MTPSPILERAFAETFAGGAATALVEAPGRINLMGDHIDYHGLDVLPMALAQRVRLLMRVRADPVVRVCSTLPTYGERVFEAAPVVPRGRAGDWGNYVRAAVQALYGHVAGAARGFDAILASDIPIAAGLGSSSALVVASGLAFLHANEIDIAPIELATILADAERYVGTRGGGMDQACCLLARKGHAACCRFDPLDVIHVPVPHAWRFIVVHSGQSAEKSGAARRAYNERASASSAAVRLVCARLAGRSVAAYGSTRSLRDLLAEHGPKTLVDAARPWLEPTALARFRHVVREGERVKHAAEALSRGGATRFGRLMNASHASLREDYEVSTAALDQLTGIMREEGALGARLTGAGLGGCAIGLCMEDDADRLMDAVDRRLSADLMLPTTTTPARSLFAATPAGGATVTPL